MTNQQRTIPRRRSFPAGGISIAAVLLFAGCGSDDNDQAAGAATVDITAIDFAYVDVPEKIQAGASLTLDNDSDVEVHELVAIRLPDDEARPVEELVMLPPDELGALFPLVETVIIAPPGETGFAVEGDGTLTEPGRYALICVIPTGADPTEYLAAAAEAEGGPPEVDGGPPHIAKGMFAEVTVE